MIAYLPIAKATRFLGRSQPWYSRVERGADGSVVTADDAARLAETLGIPPKKLFAEDPD